MTWEEFKQLPGDDPRAQITITGLVTVDEVLRTDMSAKTARDLLDRYYFGGETETETNPSPDSRHSS